MEVVSSNDVERALRDVHKYLADIDQNMTLVRSEVDQMYGTVTDIRSTVDITRSQLQELSDAFYAYVEQAQRTAAVQRAETKMGNLEAELERQYGHYGVVRRSSVGVLQAFDVGNVSDRMVAQVSEELMIQSPRYWLAPALVGIAAWSRDDREIAERSIAEAYKRDQAKTALFYSLVLRRMGRHDAGLRWLRHYLMSCQSDALTREFAVILECAAQGAFGPDGEKLMSHQIREWNDELRKNQAIVDSQVAQWESELLSNSQVLDADEYPMMRLCSPDFERVSATLNAATALPRTEEKYTAIKNTEYTAPASVEDMLDDLLEQLVSEYDAEELPMRREVEYNRAIIEEDGDMKRAEERASIYQSALEETIDAVEIQTRTAITPDLMGVSVSTQKVSIGTGVRDFLAALDNYTREYRAQAPTQINIALSENHSNEAQSLGFIGYQCTTSTPENEAVAGISNAWEQTLQSRISEATFKVSMILPACIAAAVIVVIGFMISPVAGAFLLLAAGGGAAFYSYRKYVDCNKQVENLQSMKQNVINQTCAIYRGVCAEFFDATLEYQELDSHEADLRHLLETWPTADVALESAES